MMKDRARRERIENDRKQLRQMLGKDEEKKQEPQPTVVKYDQPKIPSKRDKSPPLINQQEEENVSPASKAKNEDEAMIARLL